MDTYNKKKVLFIYYGVLMFLSFQVSHVSSATDIISTKKPLYLSEFKTIVSRNEVFELGLFNPNPATTPGSVYLGMWYKQYSPRTIVWVANREFPILKPNSINLKIIEGNLVLYDNSTVITIWSTGLNSSSTMDVQAVLYDNGNLVLRNGPTSSASVLWQSFDHPTNTWLPGAKFWCNDLKLDSQRLVSWKSTTNPSSGKYSLEIDPSTNNSFIMVLNGSKSYWSSGPWDVRFNAFKEIPNTLLRFNLSTDQSYITYSLPYGLYRFVMDVSGQFKLYNGNVALQIWKVITAQPRDICDVYKCCGSFGICNGKRGVSPCSCVPGFRRQGSDPNDFSSGCTRRTKLQCGNVNVKFIPIRNTKLATNPITLVLTPNLVTTCASACLANCYCQAYAYDGNKCLIWSRYAFNLIQLIQSSGEGQTFFLRDARPSIPPPTFTFGKTNHSKGRSIVLPVVLSSLVGGVVVFCVGLYCYITTKREKTQREKRQIKEMLGGGIIDDDGEQMCYLNLHDIMVATNSFAEENKLGEGGFGPVYKGKLTNGMDVAIKRLSKKSSQGLTEFKNEVVLIIKLQHKNLVRLLGYCVENDEKLLIYEYMSNKSLDSFLFDPVKCRELDWEKRMNIVNGTTRGLQYLHEDSRLKIIHRDLKASNVLLDEEKNPKISDFGTARIFGCKQIDDSTERIVGTFGYMSPEYALGGMISEKSDIYSFGVLLLEIISGKKATRFVHNDKKHSLVAYAWESWCETKGINIIEEALCGLYSIKEAMQCVHIALLCVQDHPNDRPTISQIVYMLSNDNNLPIPKKPTFSNVLNYDQQITSDYEFSISEATQTEMEAR
ncbi:unnamed protein product [Cochlearia groenlandica]